MRNIRIHVDYEKLYKSLFKPGKIVTSEELRKELEIETGYVFTSITQVVTTLTLHYPIWSPTIGKYKIMEDSDYDNYCNGEED